MRRAAGERKQTTQGRDGRTARRHHTVELDAAGEAEAAHRLCKGHRWKRILARSVAQHGSWGTGLARTGTNTGGKEVYTAGKAVKGGMQTHARPFRNFPSRWNGCVHTHTHTLEWLLSRPSRRVGKSGGEVDDLPSRPTCQALAFYTFFSPSTIYILFPYSFRILVPNRVYILEYVNNTAPNRAYILKYSLFSRGKLLKIASKKNTESE